MSVSSSTNLVNKGGASPLKRLLNTYYNLYIDERSFSCIKNSPLLSQLTNFVFVCHTLGLLFPGSVNFSSCVLFILGTKSKLRSHIFAS